MKKAIRLPIDYLKSGVNQKKQEEDLLPYHVCTTNLHMPALTELLSFSNSQR